MSEDLTVTIVLDKTAYIEAMEKCAEWRLNKRQQRFDALVREGIIVRVRE